MRVVRFESLHSDPKPVAKVEKESTRPILVANTESPEYQAAYAKTKQQIKDGTL